MTTSDPEQSGDAATDRDRGEDAGKTGNSLTPGPADHGGHGGMATRETEAHAADDD